MLSRGGHRNIRQELPIEGRWMPDNGPQVADAMRKAFHHRMEQLGLNPQTLTVDEQTGIISVTWKTDDEPHLTLYTREIQSTIRPGIDNILCFVDQKILHRMEQRASEFIESVAHVSGVAKDHTTLFREKIPEKASFVRSINGVPYNQNQAGTISIDDKGALHSIQTALDAVHGTTWLHIDLSEFSPDDKRVRIDIYDEPSFDAPSEWKPDQVDENHE